MTISKYKSVYNEEALYGDEFRSVGRPCMICKKNSGAIQFKGRYICQDCLDLIKSLR
jgi:hypothetical protein